MDFSFDRLGIRVPTVMISPYIKKGTVISDVHDHTSILKMLEDRWGLDPLSERDKNANDFSKVLSLKSPRKDFPEIKARHYEVSNKAREEPLNDLQKGMLMVMAGFEDALQIKHDDNLFKKAEDLYQLVMDEGRIAHIKTVGEAIDFTMDFDRRTSKRLSFWKWLRRKIERIFA
jgi:phospholipase C